jgi:uncharacterized protein (TIGR02996 family)
MPPRRTPPSPLPVEPYWQSLPGSRALLHAIAEEPWHEGLRLILADWLDDHGEDAHAEFIRVQLQRHRLLWWDSRHDTLRARERQLLEENGQRWLAGLPDLEDIRWDFESGLLELAERSGAPWRVEPRCCSSPWTSVA